MFQQMYTKQRKYRTLNIGGCHIIFFFILQTYNTYEPIYKYICARQLAVRWLASNSVCFHKRNEKKKKKDGKCQRGARLDGSKCARALTHLYRNRITNIIQIGCLIQKRQSKHTSHLHSIQGCIIQRLKKNKNNTKENSTRISFKKKKKENKGMRKLLHL